MKWSVPESLSRRELGGRCVCGCVCVCAEFASQTNPPAAPRCVPEGGSGDCVSARALFAANVQNA
eukprot:11191240-Lingulodinium_polyedra.AAC.1